MRAMALLVFLVFLSGCAVSRATIKSNPPNVTKQQAQLDDLACANASQRGTPLSLFDWTVSGLANSAYKDCLKAKGYTVGD